MIKKFKILTLLIIMPIVFSVFSQDLFAAEKSDKHLTLKTQVEQNDETDALDIKIAVQNISSEKVKNLKIIGSIPDGMEIASQQSNILEVGESFPGMTEEIEYSLKVTPEEDKIVTSTTNPTNNSHDVIENTGTKNNYINENDVDTGDYNSIGLWILIGGSAFVLILVMLKKKKKLNSLSILLLCISMSIPIGSEIKTVNAIEDSKKFIEISDKITIDGQSYIFNTKVEYSELEDIQISNDKLTRSEWIAELVNVMGYSDCEVEYDENEIPYSDIKEHKNFEEIMIAFANGFIPETDANVFNPDELATREFAATTSVLALGFVPTRDILCEDANDITYKQEVETAVAMDIFRLDDSKFYPSRKLSRTESEAAIKGIKEILDSEKIDESYESDIEYKDGIVELPDNSIYKVDGNMITLNNQDIVPKISNETILVLPDQTPYEVVSITNQDGKYIIETKDPKIEETIDSIDVQGYGTLDMKEFIPADGVTISNPNSKSARANIADISGTLGRPGEIEFNIKKTLGKGELFGKFKVDLPKVLYKADIDLGWSGFDVNNVYLKVPTEIEIDGGFKLFEHDGNIGKPWEPKGGIFELGKVPVGGVPGATVYVQVALAYNVEGRLHAVYTLDGTTGIQILNNRLRLINDLNSKLEIPELEATAKIGPKVSGLLEICNRWDLIDFSASIGGAVNGTGNFPSLGLFCLDVNAYMYGEISALQTGVVGDWLDIGYTWEFWGKNSSPLKKNWHYENLLKVNECTATKKGIIKGMVAEAENRSNAIEGATVTVYDKGNLNEITSQKTDPNGNYEIKLNEGDYVVIITAEGYLSFECDVKVVDGEEQYIQTFLLIDEENYGIYGVAEGMIKNAVTGNNISDVKLSFRKGWNKQDGEIVFTTKTDFNGKYQVDLPVGNYTVFMEKAGYISNTFNIIVLPVSVMHQNASLVPSEDTLPEGDLRMVLTWGSTPSDLDSHLVGPTAEGDDYFHIYYGDQSYYHDSEKYADLDLDDTSSYGPETTTIYKKSETGLYSFYVHDFSNGEDQNSTEMSSSGAIVEVYIDGKFYAGYPVPTGKKGTYWHVFDYDPEKNTITPVNEFTDGINYNGSFKERKSTNINFEMNK